MKKNVVFFVVILAVGLGVSPATAKNKKERGIWTGLAIGAGIATIFNGLEHGRWSPVITRERGYPPPPPPPLSAPAYYPPSTPVPSPAPPPQSYSYSPAFSWQGVRVAIFDRGWGDGASVLGTVVDALRSWGAEVVLLDRYRDTGDAPYVLEIQTRSESRRAVVELWMFEKDTHVVRLHGVGAAEFYYDGSDRWRSYQWATQWALRNLR